MRGLEPSACFHLRVLRSAPRSCSAEPGGWGVACAVEVLEDAAIRGRLTFGLFGDDAPLAARRFMDFVDGTTGQFRTSGGGPAYSSGSFFRVRPGVSIEGGRINGLRLTDFAGQQEYEYMSRQAQRAPPVAPRCVVTHPC